MNLPNDSSEIEHAAADFVARFDEVFGEDWGYTKSMLGISNSSEGDERAAEMIQQIFGVDSQPDHVVSPHGTFIEPKVEDEGEDWGNRALFLDSYRKLKKLLEERANRAKGS